MLRTAPTSCRVEHRRHPSSGGLGGWFRLVLGLTDTFYGSWELIAKRAAFEAHALHLNLNRVRYQQRCRECGLARKTRRATHMFRSRFGFPVPGATGECFCGCLEPPGGRDTSGRASVQHSQISVTGKGLTRSTHFSTFSSHLRLQPPDTAVLSQCQ